MVYTHYKYDTWHTGPLFASVLSALAVPHWIIIEAIAPAEWLRKHYSMLISSQSLVYAFALNIRWWNAAWAILYFMQCCISNVISPSIYVAKEINWWLSVCEWFHWKVYSPKKSQLKWIVVARNSKICMAQEGFSAI